VVGGGGEWKVKGKGEEGEGGARAIIIVNEVAGALSFAALGVRRRSSGSRRLVGG